MDPNVPQDIICLSKIERFPLMVYPLFFHLVRNTRGVKGLANSDHRRIWRTRYSAGKRVHIISSGDTRQITFLGLLRGER